MEQAISFAKRRYGAKRFMAYIQAFTGTFAADTDQRKAYTEVLNAFPFQALSVGTSPDCLPNVTLDYLQELNTRIEVWVEPDRRCAARLILSRPGDRKDDHT